MVSKTLVIVESPAKCKKIESYLGNNYKVIASYGHFTKLDSLDQIDFNSYNIKYKVDKYKVLKQLKDEIKKAKEVIIATDDDREGEAIGWAICTFCKLDLKTTKKIVFQEITKKAITNALNNIVHINMDMVKSQQCRQVLDIYLGYKVSPMLWKHIQHKLSAGRCQTPALKLIYDNEMELRSQDKSTHFVSSATFTSKNIKFTGIQPVTHDHINDFLKYQKAKRDWKLNDYKQSESTLTPPKVLITSTLQQKASSLLHYSPKMTMSYAQELYESGLITYMRTDSAIYSKDFVSLLKEHIISKYGVNYLMENMTTRLCVNSNKGKSQEAHEGIRVCDLNNTSPKTKTAQARKLYDLIYVHSVQSGMTNARVQNNIYDITSMYTYENENKIYTFQHNCKKYIFKGWKILDTNDEQDETNSIHLSYLEKLYTQESILPFKHMICKEEMVHKKLHYTESGLVQKLEQKGIGRPSTYSNIIQSLYQKNYVEKKNVSGNTQKCTTYILDIDYNINENLEEKSLMMEKSKLCITQIGIEVCEFCYTHFNELFDYEFTKFMENILDEISCGKRNHVQYLESYTKKVSDLIESSTSFIQSNPESVVKSKSKLTLHCGSYNDHPCYIKTGPYGFYVNINKTEKISLNEFKGFNIISLIESGAHELKKNEFDMIIDYIEKSKNKKNENILMIITENMSIRKSKYGNYVYFKTKQMKKPKFLKYNDEKDDMKNQRNQWIEEGDTDKVKSYLMKKYNLNI